MRKIYLTGVTGCMLLALTACSTVTHRSGEAAPAGASPAAGASVSVPTSTESTASPRATATHGTPASGSGNGSATTKPTGSTVLVPMQTPQGGEFQSPSGNITCEVDYQRAGLTQAYCQTGTPARSVTMTATGSFKTCTGEQCLGNAGEGTPTLAYGTATGVGPFRCESATTGVICTVKGKGFRIANTGVTSVTS